MGFKDHHRHIHVKRIEGREQREPTLQFLKPEDAAPLIRRFAQSSDDYGAAPGESAGSGGGGGGGGGSSSGGTGSDTSSGSSGSSSSGSSSSTESSPNGSNSLAIALGVIIPVTFIVVTMLVIWRIVKKRQRAEDANDKHASLDFGLGEVSKANRARRGKKGGKGGKPEMMDLSAEKEFRKARGLSMDMSSPYVLAGELNETRPSFHSLSRSAYDGEDPYRPVTMIRSQSPSGTQSVFSSRPPSRKDNASVWTESSESAIHGVKSNLVRNAEQPSRDSPPTTSTLETPLLNLPESTLSPVDLTPPARSLARKPVGEPTRMNEELGASDSSRRSLEAEKTGLGLHELPAQSSTGTQENKLDFNLPTLGPLTPVSEGSLPSFEFTEATSEPTEPAPAEPVSLPQRGSSARPPPATGTKHESQPQWDDDATYADVLGIVQAESSQPTDEHGLGVHGLDMENRRLSASIRPLPPDDHEENPETRANRIRSFYREYFDDSKRDTSMGYGGADYYEDYGQEYLSEATFFDPASGQFIVAGGAPYAQPVTRRAMTPPPRAPPRFRNGSGNSHRMYGSGQYGPGSRQRGHSTTSGAGFRGRQAKRQLPPPTPLNNLPTPHLLRDDSAIFNAADFAPPSTYKDRSAGRPDSPMGGSRPYTPPSVRAFTPLASSFDDLRVMPSPHALRKSGTFTGLDFAPPPRLLSETGSDAGSIRSGRSQMSASHLASIRAGAYRVSRIPKEFVGTKDDFSAALRPTWDLRGPSPAM